MKRAKVTSSLHRLPFGELDPRRFEDLALALVYGTHKWSDLQHFGRSGDDGGVDIAGTQLLENDKVRNWFVQCKRLKKAAKADLTKATDECLAKAIVNPEVLLLVVGCDVSRESSEAFQKYATSKGISTPLIWSASLLEAKLYGERSDLLFAYFGISTAERARSREATIRRNISLKKKMQKDFRVDPEEWRNSSLPPPQRRRFKVCRTYIHSIDDETYPNVGDRVDGINGWFGLEFYDFYHSGLEFGLSVQHGIIDKEGNWAFIEYQQAFDTKKYTGIKILWHARIPYRNIVDYDMDGDEYNGGPHIYVVFADGGMPYERMVYRISRDGSYEEELEPEKQFKLKVQEEKKKRSNKQVVRRPRLV